MESLFKRNGIIYNEKMHKALMKRVNFHETPIRLYITKEEFFIKSLLLPSQSICDFEEDIKNSLNTSKIRSFS
jgi:hypothetical protein